MQTLLADWRRANFVRAGVGIRFTWMPTGILSYMVDVPITLSYNRSLPV